jgi:hypothetical protein
MADVFTAFENHTKTTDEEDRYLKKCPLSKALLIIHEGLCDVLQFIGSDLDYLQDHCGLREEFQLICDEEKSGVYIWEGSLCTSQDYFGEYDEWLDGSFRPATKEEWKAHLDDEYPWDVSLWWKTEDKTKED